MVDEKDLVEFCLGQKTRLYSDKGGIVAVDGFIADAVVELVVVVFLKPQPESPVERLECDTVLDRGKETLSGGPKEAFDFSTRRAVGGLEWMR